MSEANQERRGRGSARRHKELKGLRQKGSSTLMPRSLVWGMNDHQGSWWVLIVVTRTHCPLAARSGRLGSNPQSRQQEMPKFTTEPQLALQIPRFPWESRGYKLVAS